MKFLKRISRRRRVAVNCFAGAVGGFWASRSQSFAARFIRERYAEIGQEILAPKFSPQLKTWSDDKLTAAWLGHSTVLINFFGVTILTDPVLFSRVGVNVGLGTVGPKRFVAPALSAEELPAIDLVLLSHAHLDHFDLPTLKRFPKSTQVVTARNTSDLLAKTRMMSAGDLGWGDEAKVRTAKGDLHVEAFEVNHWGGRWSHKERHRGWNGYMISRNGKKVIFGGDTALCDNFRNLRSKGPFELAIMPIGAYNPWIRAHCTPEEAVAMSNAAGAKHILPIHHQSFALGREPFKEPIERFELALDKERERIALRDIGETFMLS